MLKEVTDFLLNIEKYCPINVIEKYDYVSKLNELFKDSYGISRVDCDAMTWDFTSYFPNRRQDMRISFRSVPTNWVPVLKAFAVDCLTKKRSIGTIKTSVTSINCVLSDAFTHSTIDTIDAYLSHESLVAEMESRGNKANYRQTMYYEIITFLYFLESIFGIHLAIDFDALHKRYLELQVLSEKDLEKTPLIPAEYFECIKSKFTTVARTGYLDSEERMLAACLVMETQLGLRLEDLLILKKTDYREVTFDDGQVYCYFEYDTLKPSVNKNKPIKGTIRLNPLCVEMYKIILKLHKKLFVPEDYPYLLWMNLRQHGNELYPTIKPETFNFRMYKLFDKHLHTECRTPWPGIKKTLIKHTLKEVYIPIIKSYRVNLCTYLFDVGASPAIIRKTMAHLSRTMDGYYARDNKNKQLERIEASTRFLNTLQNEKLSPIGKKPEKLRKDIEDFLSRNDINIQDKEAIAKLLSTDKLIIKSKKCGFCVRVGNSCKDDLKTDKMLCAVGLCPNIYSYYYNLPSTYEDFDDAVYAFDCNEENGLRMATEKQGYVTAEIIKNRFLPELKQLKEKLLAVGKDEVLKLHPELESTIEDLDEIEEVVISWKRNHMNFF